VGEARATRVFRRLHVLEAELIQEHVIVARTRLHVLRAGMGKATREVPQVAKPLLG
jgi:hypothetical protein